MLQAFKRDLTKKNLPLKTRAKGIVHRLSEGRRTYRQAIAEKAKELGVEVRSLMLIFEIQSPCLGEQGNDEPERLRGWLEKAKHGISPLCEFYWEDDPWGGERFYKKMKKRKETRM